MIDVLRLVRGVIFVVCDTNAVLYLVMLIPLFLFLIFFYVFLYLFTDAAPAPPPPPPPGAACPLQWLSSGSPVAIIAILSECASNTDKPSFWVACPYWSHKGTFRSFLCDLLCSVTRQRKESLT